MATSGNPAKRAAKRPSAKKTTPSAVTSASSWKKAKDEPEPLELPSGNTALVRRPGLSSMLSSGLFPDSLTAIAAKSADAGKNGMASGLSDKMANDAMDKMMGDPERIGEMFATFDQAAALVVVEPTCLFHMKKVDGKMVDLTKEERYREAESRGFAADDVIWTDEVDLEDKIYIFQFAVGGTRDLESFRKQLAESVEGVERS